MKHILVKNCFISAWLTAAENLNEKYAKLNNSTREPRMPTAEIAKAKQVNIELAKYSERNELFV